MTKPTLTVLLGFLILVGAARSAAEPPRNESVLFCPECWVYLGAPGSMDLAGYCAGCGKYPIEMNAQRMEWFWCATSKSWKRQPCPENKAKHCCTREESFAEIVPAGVPVAQAWYCPTHQSFAAIQIPILAQWRCAVCARPAVRVNARERAWTWCASEGVWGTAPCSMNALRHCCTKREGFLLVQVESGPIARR